MLRSVFSTLSENCSKVPCVICLRKASHSIFADTMLNMFSIGLRSGERAGILNNRAPTSCNAVCALELFWLGSPSCKKCIALGFVLVWKCKGNLLRMWDAKNSPFNLWVYLSQHITPFLYAIATKKWTTFPWTPAFFPFDVQ